MQEVPDFMFDGLAGGMIRAIVGTATRLSVEARPIAGIATEGGRTRATSSREVSTCRADVSANSSGAQTVLRD